MAAGLPARSNRKSAEHLDQRRSSIPAVLRPLHLVVGRRLRAARSCWSRHAAPQRTL